MAVDQVGKLPPTCCTPGSTAATRRTARGMEKTPHTCCRSSPTLPSLPEDEDSASPSTAHHRLVSASLPWSRSALLWPLSGWIFGEAMATPRRSLVSPTDLVTLARICHGSCSPPEIRHPPFAGWPEALADTRRPLPLAPPSLLLPFVAMGSLMPSLFGTSPP
ncbi:hypothetical protein ACLOJK_008188 [Asimina triloba]